MLLGPLIAKCLVSVIGLGTVFKLGTDAGYKNAMLSLPKPDNNTITIPASDFKKCANARTILNLRGKQRKVEADAISEYLTDMAPTDCEPFEHCRVHENQDNRDVQIGDKILDTCTVWMHYESRVWQEWTYNRTLPDFNLKTLDAIVEETAKLMGVENKTERGDGDEENSETLNLNLISMMPETKDKGRGGDEVGWREDLRRLLEKLEQRWEDLQRKAEKMTQRRKKEEERHKWREELHRRWREGRKSSL